MKMIDADALFKSFESEENPEDSLWTLYGIKRKIEDAPRQEPKMGHWTHDGSHWKNRFICTECNYKLFDEPTNYCPNCGARMVEPQERSK